MRHYVTLSDGTDLHVRVSGAGPAVLVLHDWPMSGALAAELAPALPLTATVVAPDSPGYGQSPAAASVLDLPAHVRVVTQLLDLLAVERCVVIGTGLGATVAVALAVQAGDRVAAVFVDKVPNSADLARLDLDRLCPERELKHSGAHVVEAWHQVRDAMIFDPWYAVDQAHRIHRSVPDPRTLHRRVVDMICAAGQWRDGVRAALSFDVDAAQAALPPGVVRPIDKVEVQRAVAALPAVDACRLAAGLEPRPHTGGTSRRYLRTRAGSVHARLDGDPAAQPVLLLHPSPGSADTYRDVIADLARDFLVVGMDLIGNGYSDKSSLPDPEIADYALVAGEALEQLGLSRAIAFGSHTGASVALEAVARRPDLFCGLVLEGLAHFTGAEQADVLTHYTPTFEPVHSGAHLVAQWHMLRDMHMFWPWFASTAENLRETAPSLPGLHNLFVQMLKTGGTYVLGYRAAFRHDPKPALSALALPGHLTAHSGDMLRDSTEALASTSSWTQFVELSPSEGRGPAWAVRRFASETRL